MQSFCADIAKRRKQQYSARSAILVAVIFGKEESSGIFS